MCGIYGVVETSFDAADEVFNGLKDIEYRGYDSWGVAYWKIDGGMWKIEKEVGFLPSTFHFPSSNISIGHTRWATHGGVTRENAHPHSDCHNKLVLVHNGIVENYLELKSKLKNHQFKSETDTEVIVHLIEDQLLKTPDLIEATSKVFNKLEGLSAILVSDGKSIVAVKNSSPLVLGQTKEGFVIASDPNAILPLTNKLLFLEDGILVSLGETLQVFDVKTLKKLPFEFKAVDWEHTTSSMEEYPHYMLKEIYEQPKILRNLAHHSSQISEIGQYIKESRGTFFIACGSAAYSCLAGVYLFSKFAKRHVNFSVGSEFNYIQDYITDKSLVIAVSQSGESIDTLEPVTVAKKKGAKIIGLVNVLGSTLYRMADLPVLLQAGPEKAVASTKALISMMAVMILTSLSLAGKAKEASNILQKSAAEISSILEHTKAIEDLAEKLKKVEHIYVLGRGLSYPVALEATLKIKEVSYIHSEGFAGGELKHGVIALISKGTPVIVFAPNDETYESMISNAMEVKARGAYVIGIGYKENPVFDYFFKVEDVGASSIIPHIVFAQLLAYFLSVKLGHNPDKPRNLAKSVTVK